MSHTAYSLTETHMIAGDAPVEIMLSGDTYPLRDGLAERGWKWNRTKSVWRKTIAAGKQVTLRKGVTISAIIDGVVERVWPERAPSAADMRPLAPARHDGESMLDYERRCVEAGAVLTTAEAARRSGADPYDW